MATKEEARKASRAAYKRNVHPSDVPAGYTLDTQHSGKRVKVFVHQGNQNVIVAHRGTKGLADVLTDATAVIGGRKKHNKRFQHAQAVTDRVRAAHTHANITAVGHSLGGTLAQDTKGTNKQITFNKRTSLHDVLYRCRKPTQTDYRKAGDVISVFSGSCRP
jgi:putative lipase involved disintegration of autophagic bodies